MIIRPVRDEECAFRLTRGGLHVLIHDLHGGILSWAPPRPESGAVEGHIRPLDAAHLYYTRPAACPAADTKQFVRLEPERRTKQCLADECCTGMESLPGSLFPATLGGEVKPARLSKPGFGQVKIAVPAKVREEESRLVDRPQTLGPTPLHDAQTAG